MIRVLVADDHAIVRAGVKQILNECPDIEVAGEASTGEEALRMAREETYDVIVMDITMPGRGGMESLKLMKQEMPKVPVILLTTHSEDEYALRAMRAGAAGYLNKDGVPEELVTAVRKVFRGGRYITPSLAERLADAVGQDTEKLPHELLSDREYQVFIMIASGKSVGRVGEELALSVKTVSTYRTRIIEKTGLKNNSELTHYAFQQKLVT